MASAGVESAQDVRVSEANEGGAVILKDQEFFLLRGISWETYEALLADFERSGVNIRMAYDQGDLEFMSPALRHERGGALLSLLVRIVTEELNIPLLSGGSVTCKRRLIEKGVEPDECFWIANGPRMRGKEELDLEIDPPPDLAIEVENTRKLLNRLPIYGSLRFPELWRYSDKCLTVLGRQDDGTYRARPDSLSFPFLPMTEVHRLVKEGTGQDETAGARRVRAWVRAELVPRFARPEP